MYLDFPLAKVCMADDLAYSDFLFVYVYFSFESSLFTYLSLYYFALHSKEMSRKVKEILLLSKSRLTLPLGTTKTSR